MTKKITTDCFQPVSLTIEEAAEGQQVDGKYILGRIAGPFFVPDGKSRNGRFYPRRLWENVCKDQDVQTRISDRRMFGTAGHNCELNDDALRDGEISHFITKLEIRGDVGYGEALILDTEVGRTLNTLLRAGCKLFVSSRANGEYKGETDEGLPIVDPETYQLITFDFVLEPGFLQANPKLVENHTSHSIPEGDFCMEKLIEQLSKENGSLKADLDRCLKEVETLKNENRTVCEENKHLAAKTDKVESLGRLVERYRAYGSPDEIGKALEAADRVISQFKKLGTVKEIGKALELAHATLRQYKSFGEAKEVGMAMERAVKTIKAYQEMGTIPELKQLFAKVEENQNKIAEAKREQKIAALSKELNVSEESIKVLYGKVSEADIRKLFAPAVNENKPAENKPSTNWRKTKKDEDKKDASPSLFDKTRASRLMESFCK